MNEFMIFLLILGGTTHVYYYQQYHVTLTLDNKFRIYDNKFRIYASCDDKKIIEDYF